MKKIQANLVATNLKIAIVGARFNELLTDKLIEGAIDEFLIHGGLSDNITLVSVPGAFEIPLAVQKLAQTSDYDAIVGIGLLIKGATAHFEYISSAMSSGLSKVSLDTNTPVSFGVLTTDNIEQAIERCGSKAGNKGRECMLAAIEMANLMKQL